MSKSAAQITYIEACKILGLSPRQRASGDSLENAYNRRLIEANFKISSALTQSQRDQGNENLLALQNAWRVVKAGRSGKTWRKAPSTKSRRNVSVSGSKVVCDIGFVIRIIFRIIVRVLKGTPSFVRILCSVCNASAQDVGAILGLPKLAVVLLVLSVLIGMLHGCCVPSSVGN